jgi:hypothetical protein
VPQSKQQKSFWTLYSAFIKSILPLLSCIDIQDQPDRKEVTLNTFPSLCIVFKVMAEAGRGSFVLSCILLKLGDLKLSMNKIWKRRRVYRPPELSKAERSVRFAGRSCYRHKVPRDARFATAARPFMMLHHDRQPIKRPHVDRFVPSSCFRRGRTSNNQST